MKLRTITVKVPEPYVEALDELVRKGRFATRSEAIRIAIKEFLERYNLSLPDE